MRSEVTVTFDGTAAPLRIDLEKVEPMTLNAARDWLDRQFTEMECEPLRPTGKVLSADKVVLVAEAAGPAKFSEPEWAQKFGAATSALLGKPVVRIDLGLRSIGY